MTPQAHAGACLCGQVHYTISSAPTTVCICHCSICRRSVGAPAVAWATFPRAAFVVEGTVSWYQSSSHARRGFCSACGTSLFFATDQHRHEIEVTVVSLADAGKVAPRYHSWAPNKLPWEHIGDGLPRYREDGGSLPMEASSS